MAKLVAGVNDLATVYPKLAAEWHPTKNGDLTPSDVMPGNNKKVWWRCANGHEWQASPNQRTNSKTECPYCSGRVAMPGQTDLATTHPELAGEWHPTKNGDLTPEQVTAGSNKRVWWQCANGHEWQACVYSRTITKSGCPYCTGRLAIIGETDLATVNPRIAREWHPTKNGDLTPEQITAFSSKKVWWQCSYGHEWQSMVHVRTRGQGMCPVCWGEAQTSFAEQAIFYYLKQLTHAENRYILNSKSEIDVYLPDYQIGIEYDGEQWHIDVEKDIRKNRLCREKGIRLIRVREPGCPDIPGEHVVLKSLTMSELNKAIQKLCALIGQNVDVNVERDRCAIYGLYIETEKGNNLATVNPELAAQWHPTKNGELKPSQITVGSDKKVWWLGKCGHEWQARVPNRMRGAGCPVCNGKKVLPGFNDLATTHPNLAAEWHPTKNGDLTPSDVTKGSKRKAWWLGKCGHEWETPIQVRYAGGGCPVCAKKKHNHN